MTDDELVGVLKALAHPVRLRIMKVLSGTERNVGEIDDAAGIGQPTLSQQLAVLRKTGLVKTRKEAKLVYYRIDEGRLAKAIQAAGELSALPAVPIRLKRQAAPGVANFARLG